MSLLVQAHPFLRDGVRDLFRLDEQRLLHAPNPPFGEGMDFSLAVMICCMAYSIRPVLRN